jgi:hypothetical protein
VVADKIPSNLIPAQTTTIVASLEPLIKEQVFCYRREQQSDARNFS